MFNFRADKTATMDMSDRSGAWNGSEMISTTGLVGGTKVATPTGWRVVEGVVAGDKVLTFDGGMQTVIEVRRRVLWSGARPCPDHMWPMLVPAGALGNREDMWMAPEQHVLLESDTAEQVFGDPFALIPAAALEGFRGIQRSFPHEKIDVIELVFAQDEVVFANSGALFFCPRGTDFVSDLFGGAEEPLYTPLSVEQADDLIECLLIEDQSRRPAAAQHGFRAAA
ncbi:Hint domain-containing protein [Nereida sp. MMG025]|uniref:Hint domain-containing protein n=1 Tax=Nereida sp. MMG025 TaxID=2909981 RepID=UPI001F33915F|nr:Hint domain-containing protein [Nereida sp. MMG025]MCF6444003.1 Hint domain-containing protein [Nereida sp. MMG025]